MIDIIMKRRSVRTYNDKGLTASELSDLKKFADNIDTPFGISQKFRFLDADEFGLKSPVLSGVRIYVAGKTKVMPYADVAFGYAFEKLLLHAIEMGLGTVWIAGTMNRDAFELAMDLQDNEMMPAMSPLGHPAAKMSFRETLMRKGVKADSRLPIDKLFFSGSFENPVSEAKYSEMKECLETLRWAPSAVNKQPWRVVLCEDSIHFYEHHDKGYIQPNGMDLQKVDMGIAICHLDLALDEKNIGHSIIIEDPGISVPENVDYIATFVL